MRVALLVMVISALFVLSGCQKYEYPLAEADDSKAVIEYKNGEPNKNQWPTGS